MKRTMQRVLQVLTAGVVLVVASSFAETAQQDVEARLEKGREIAFDRRKGNCLACHVIEGGELAGNYGPPLIMMQARFPERDVLRAQIWDASTRMPDTRMPPYGRHRILTEEEIDLVVDFLLTL
jgi:sulfur-oxidizing protein SoxX